MSKRSERSEAAAPRTPRAARGTPSERRQAHGRYYVEALGRGLARLDCFIAEPVQLTLLELSERVGLNLPTAFRLIRTLEEAGYVRQDPVTKRYQLSLKMLELQEATLSILDYATVARPYLEELAVTLGESVGMAVLDGIQVRHALRIASNRLVSANIPVGALFPPHATAMGKVLFATLPTEVVRDLHARHYFERYTAKTITAVEELLAQLAVVGRQGYAISDGEWEIGLRTIAAPVSGRDGHVVGAVCVVTVRPGVTRTMMVRDFLPQLLRTANVISAQLGYRGEVLVPASRARQAEAS